MSSESFRYILRYLICPTHAPQDRIAELTDFCVESNIEEVMIFFTAEELTIGHPTIEELEPWVEMFKQLKKSLDSRNIDLSINPWTTTFHVARGRKMKPGQDFTLMVGETGATAKISACPLCENWQKYLCDTFAYVVGEIKPTALWVEDDWRLHNHEADMGFGGCFCELHLKRFADKIGRQSVTRQEVLDAILAPGEVNPWRKAWFEVWRDTMIEPAVKLHEAMKKTSPQTRLALMSSGPDVHSIEHRDWHALQDALGFEPAFLIRPHLPPYTEFSAMTADPAITRMTLANLKRPIEVYPELENSPRNGIYTKSKRFSAMECLESVCYGSHGITINHYDMMGNGISLDPDFGKMLASIKARLNVVCNLNIDDANAAGVSMLFSPEVALHHQYNPGFASTDDQSMFRLLNNSLNWAHTLYTLGVNFSWQDKVADTAGKAVFACDQTLRAFSDDDIRQLLGGVLVLDAVSVEILQQRGFGEYLGVETRGWTTLDDAGYAYEEIPGGKKELYGVDSPRMTASRCSDKILLLDSAADAQARTRINDAFHNRVCDGMVTYRNSLGGVVVSTAYLLGRLQYFMGYFNVYRKVLWQELLWELCGEAMRYVMAESHPMRVYRNKTERGEFIALLNQTLDDVAEVVIRVGGLDAGAAERVKMIDPLGQLVNLNVYFPEVLSDGSQRWKIHQPVTALNVLYLLVDNK